MKSQGFDDEGEHFTLVCIGPGLLSTSMQERSLCGPLCQPELSLDALKSSPNPHI